MAINIQICCQVCKEMVLSRLPAILKLRAQMMPSAIRSRAFPTSLLLNSVIKAANTQPMMISAPMNSMMAAQSAKSKISVKGMIDKFGDTIRFMFKPIRGRWVRLES